MADGTTLNSGTGGDVIATDDILGVKHQRVKVEFGADGSATDVSSSNPLPVIAAANSGVDIGDVTINNAAGSTSVPVQGAAAADAAVAGNPVLLGGRASAAAPTDVSADGDAVSLWTTLKGALHVADGGGTLSVDDGGGRDGADAHEGQQQLGVGRHEHRAQGGGGGGNYAALLAGANGGGVVSSRGGAGWLSPGSCPPVRVSASSALPRGYVPAPPGNPDQPRWLHGRRSSGGNSVTRRPGRRTPSRCSPQEQSQPSPAQGAGDLCGFHSRKAGRPWAIVYSRERG